MRREGGGVVSQLAQAQYDGNEAGERYEDGQEHGRLLLQLVRVGRLRPRSKL